MENPGTKTNFFLNPDPKPVIPNLRPKSQQNMQKHLHDIETEKVRWPLGASGSSFMANLSGSCFEAFSDLKQTDKMNIN